MLKAIYSLLKAFVFLSLLVGAIYYGGFVSFKIGDETVEIYSAALVFALGAFLFLWGALKRATLKIFSGKPRYEKGLDGLQSALSAAFLKDKSTIEKSLKKAEKYLGNIPMVSWLRGQQSLIEGDEHRAKAIFYGLCEREKDTVFGAYSLSQLAIKDKSGGDALSAINSVLKVFPNAQELVLQAIAIAVRSKNFAEAEKRLSSLKRSDKSRLIEAVVYSEEAVERKDGDLLKKAFKLAPELSENAINYAEFLIKNDEMRAARDVLRKSFRASPNQKIFDKYISVDADSSNLDKIKLANKLINAAPESWIGYYGQAKLLISEEMTQAAFQNLLTAYEKEPLDFIEEKLVKVAKSFGEKKPPEVAEVLSRRFDSKCVNFVWKCGCCGAEEPEWTAVCKYCDRIAEYRWTTVQKSRQELTRLPYN
ncbi:MAG: hypothetical protein LBL99_02290 [Holosporaceae bacterium]|jgi:uncharacterized membrane-anchored protein|nr:hypothetical protein [Holosporaceae bacterium]